MVTVSLRPVSTGADVDTRMRNHQLAHEVLRAIRAASPRLGTAITVIATRDGSVLLRGQVPDRHTQDQLEALVKRTPGVARVFSHLDVRSKVRS